MIFAGNGLDTMRGASPLESHAYSAVGYGHHGKALALTGTSDMRESVAPLAQPTYALAELGSDPLLKTGLSTQTKFVLGLLGLAAVGGAIYMLRRAS